jgi:hypothetical protein
MGQRPRASINKAENSSLLSYSMICQITCLKTARRSAHYALLFAAALRRAAISIDALPETSLIGWAWVVAPWCKVHKRLGQWFRVGRIRRAGPKQVGLGPHAAETAHHRLLTGLPAHSNKRMGAKAGFVPRFCHHDRESASISPAQQEQSRISPSDTVVVLTCAKGSR